MQASELDGPAETQTQNSHLLSAQPCALFNPNLRPPPPPPRIPGPTARDPLTMNKMKNFKRRLSLSVPRTETIEESLAEFTEQFNQLHNRRNEGEGSSCPPAPPWPSLTQPSWLGEDRGGRQSPFPSPPAPGRRGRVGS